MTFRSFIFGGCLLLANGLHADVLLRPLPITNLNESAGADRSNASFTQEDPTQRMIGDFFVAPSNAMFWRINSIDIFSVGSVLGQALGQEFDNVSLYGGVRSQGDFGLLSTGTPNTFFEPSTSTVLNSNPDITHTQVQYRDGEDYEGIGAPGVFFPIWRTHFSNLNWVVPGGSIVDFAGWGTARIRILPACTDSGLLTSRTRLRAVFSSRMPTTLSSSSISRISQILVFA